MRNVRTCYVFGLLLLLHAAPALADAANTPRLREGAPVPVQGYGRQNPACLEWTDGCVLCVSTAGHAQCSTPGIACQPAGLTCKHKSQ